MRKKSKNFQPLLLPASPVPSLPRPTEDSAGRRSWRSQPQNPTTPWQTEELWASPQRRRYLHSLLPEAAALA
jgi:hypothetical protein